MMVKVDQLDGSTVFEIADSRYKNDRWEYQLKRSDGTLHKNGDWFAQTNLSFER